ncbi:MAG: hypothetical protein GXY82_04025 [Methanospirillum sp.]|nr:hypothetical protein [Methanospirillum sp.]
MKTIGIPGLLTIEFGPTATATSPVTSPVPTTNPSPPTIEGRYLMDGNPGRLIVISSDGGNAYSIGEATGSWPWDGNVILDGDQIIGQAFEKNTPASFKLEGTVLDDKRIVIAYKFITDGAGRDATGRVDDHILTPVI